MCTKMANKTLHEPTTPIDGGGPKSRGEGGRRGEVEWEQARVEALRQEVEALTAQ